MNFFDPNDYPPLFSAAIGADGYKFDHRRQYPDKTEIVVANFTPRSSRRGASHVVLFGTQLVVIRSLIQLWNKTFFNRPKKEVIEEFILYVNAYLGADNQVGHSHMEELHDLGYLPVQILALPEGTVYPLRVPGFVIFNTDPRFYWVTNFLETILSAELWSLCTTATTAKIYFDMLQEFALATVGPEADVRSQAIYNNPSFTRFQGHDFSFRGQHGSEAAAKNGVGHLTCFFGTDTPPSIQVAVYYYRANLKTEIIGASVPATEHSVMCAGGMENETETFRRLIEDIYPKGIVSIVSDTWSYWDVLKPNDGILAKLKEKIMKRDGKVVIRPDTGDPVKIVCGESMPVKTITAEVLQHALQKGYKTIQTGDCHFLIEVGRASGLYVTRIPDDQVTPEMKGSVRCLWEIFGGTSTKAGYRLLDQHIGLIYGDSITYERAYEICYQLMMAGFASTNVVFGIGSYTYAYVTRDTDGYAIKATFVRIDGQDREIFKAPKTGDGTKNSAKGLPAVFKNEKGEYYLKEQATWEELLNCELQTIFKDGELVTVTTLHEIRQRLSVPAKLLA